MEAPSTSQEAFAEVPQETVIHRIEATYERPVRPDQDETIPKGYIRVQEYELCVGAVQRLYPDYSVINQVCRGQQIDLTSPFVD